MMAAGIDVRWGIEIDPRIAAVANANLGGHVRTANILAANPAEFEPVDVLHASPPCPNFSNAKTGAVETRNDMRLAGRVCWFLRVLQPRIFTLENVWYYRKSKSWNMIENRLHALGYWVHVAHVNMADFGVPQTRKRMIVRAVRGGWVPMLPEPQPWVSWYDAISDLVDELPDTELAPWQLARLTEMPQVSSLFSEGIGKDRKSNDYPLISRPVHAPAYTVTANHNMASMKALLVSSGNSSKQLTVCNDQDPAMTVTASFDRTPARALLVNGGNPRAGNNWPTVRTEDQPAMTVTANQSRMPVRAILADVGNGRGVTGKLTTREASQPAMTIAATQGSNALKGITDQRIVSISPRCLARWQTFPDWYELPDLLTLATRIIGNAVPPKLMAAIYGQLLVTEEL